MLTANTNSPRKSDKLHAPCSAAQRAAILDELDNLLDDPLFKNSKRCVHLLRWLVENALQQNLSLLKERTLGIEVFGRPADYDTNADPVVRMTANEIRKRLALYNQKDTPHKPVKICLVPGNYIPEFVFADNDIHQPAAHDSTEAPVLPPGGPPSVLAPAPDLHSKSARRTVQLFAGILLSLVLAVSFYFSFRKPSIIQRLWTPILNAQADPILCLSDDPTFIKIMKEDSAQGLKRAHDLATHVTPGVSNPESYQHTTSFGDLNVAHRIAVWLADHHRYSIARPTSELTFAEFRGKPAVLIGAYNNPWSILLLSHLRFTTHIDSNSHTMWIEDSLNPGNRTWSRPYAQNGEPLEDFAIISRFWNQDTGGWLYSIAGLGKRGTEAAGMLLSTQPPSPLLPQGITANNNFQIVLKVSVINGRSANTQILAFHTW